MSRDEIIVGLRQNIEKVVRVTFEGGEDIQDLTIINVDDEGFVSKSTEELLWATFDDVENVELIAVDGP